MAQDSPVGHMSRPQRPRFAGGGCRALMLLLAILLTVPASAIVTYHAEPVPQTHLTINVLVGADRFYNAGYFGQGVVVANVEAGHVWNGHETLTHVLSFVNAPSINNPVRQYDYHATAVGFVLNGLGPLTPQGYYYSQFGMAPGANLVSAAIATHWIGNQGQFDISHDSFTYAYRSVLRDGVPVQIIPGISITTVADVVNSSWGFADPAAQAEETRTLDALVYLQHQTVVFAAGNHDPNTSEPVGGPASGYNVIAVGALTGDTTSPPFSQLANFSSTGPNDFYNPQTGQYLAAVRPAVDIVAPGDDLFLAAYTGVTGTNPFGTDPYPGADDLYFTDLAGTSFASPVVAGGAALLVHAGKANFGGGEAIDGRVIKAVLLNSAAKLDSWTNHAHFQGQTLVTSQGLDHRLGAGALDLNRAYDQYLSGTHNLTGLTGGIVDTLGWDMGLVGNTNFNTYFFNREILAGETLAATLTWFVNRSYSNTFDLGSDVAFSDLDLQLWRVDDGSLTSLVAESSTRYNNVEHLFLTLADAGYYALRVLWMGQIYDLPGNTPDQEFYALAWSSLFRADAPAALTPPAIPEPLTAPLTLFALLTLTIVRTRRR